MQWRQRIAILKCLAMTLFSPPVATQQANARQLPYLHEVIQRATLTEIAFGSIDGWRTERALQSWKVFHRHCEWIMARQPSLRDAKAVSPDILKVCKDALSLPAPATHALARRHFETLFQPYRIEHKPSANPYEGGFLTGYYEPVIDGSLEKSAKYGEPVFARPVDLVSDRAKISAAGLPDDVTGARRTSSGSLEPYPARADIDAGAISAQSQPLLWLRDGIELFMLQVQGSGRVRLPDGKIIRLVYDGRNGRPYTSIGRLLVERGLIAKDAMSLARLKSWVRKSGQAQGQAGRRLMQENQSYVFFRIETAMAAESGPVGGAGLPLSRLRSIAVDRNLWPYGLPFWIEAGLPWRGPQKENFARLMIAQDTGSAIVGAARADIFFGTGNRAGRLAGNIRHPGRFIVFLPRKDGVLQ